MNVGYSLALKLTGLVQKVYLCLKQIIVRSGVLMALVCWFSCCPNESIFAILLVHRIVNSPGELSDSVW